MKWVHIACLQQWIKSRPVDQRRLHCETCLAKYRRIRIAFTCDKRKLMICSVRLVSIVLSLVGNIGIPYYALSRLVRLVRRRCVHASMLHSELMELMGETT